MAGLERGVGQQAARSGHRGVKNEFQLADIHRLHYY
jgi:hypothetical protein